MIIVEGPDGSGKTTLLKALSEELNLDIAPNYATSRHKMSEQGVRKRVFHGVASMLEGREYLHDRLYWSEVVYGSILRGGVMFTSGEMFWFEELCRRFSVPVLFCIPPYWTTHTNVLATQQMKGVWARHEDVYNTYVKLARDHNFRTYDYTSEHDTVESVVEWLRPKILQLERTFGNANDDSGGR